MAEVKFKGLEEWRKHLGDLKFEAAAKRGLISGAMRAIPVLHKATDNAPKASPNGARGANVEGGRRKGARMPPPKALISWAKQRAGLSHKEAEKAAFAMALAIKKRGLKPRNILKNSLGNIKRLMLKEIEHELRLELTTK